MDLARTKRSADDVFCPSQAASLSVTTNCQPAAKRHATDAERRPSFGTCLNLLYCILQYSIRTCFLLTCAAGCSAVPPRRWVLPLAEEKHGEATDTAIIHTSICEELLAQALGDSPHAHTDVVFEIDGVWAASGHKGVLCSRSPVFASMFSIGFQEQLTGKVRIEQASNASFRMFLQFLYLGRCSCPSPFYHACAQRQQHHL
jgi:hypothetical protein